MRRNKRCSCRCRSAPRKSRAWAGQNGSTLFRSDGELLFLAPLTRHIGFENRKKVAAERLAVDVDHADAVRLARRIANRARRHFRRATVPDLRNRSEEHTSELQSLMRSSYAVFCLKKKI